MTEPRYDVVAIGNAIVDILAPATDAFIADNGMTKGAMALVFSPEEADALYAKMGPGQEVSGGSAANTIAGMAALGDACAFIGQVADDQLGEVFAHDIRAAGIRFDTPARAGAPTTGRCLIFVTPDGQRIVSGSLDETVRVWGLARGVWVRLWSLVGAEAERTLKAVVASH